LGEPDVAVLGPIARSADDLDLMLGVVAGPSPEKARAWRLQLPNRRHDRLAGFRVAAWLDDEAAPVDGEVHALLHRAASAAEKAGASVDRAARPEVSFGELVDIFFQTVFAVTTAGMPAAMHQMADQFVAENPQPEPGEAPMSVLLRAMAMRHRDWIGLHERRERARAAWARFFAGYDVVLAPAAPVAAFPHLQDDDFVSRTITINGETRPYASLGDWCGIFGTVYLPATVAPVGFTPAGLPVGIQIVGPYLDDRTTIHFARLLTDVVGGYSAPPGFVTP
jgi:amidase